VTERVTGAVPGRASPLHSQIQIDHPNRWSGVFDPALPGDIQACRMAFATCW
jgi:hypothetical protein